MTDLSQFVPLVQIAADWGVTVPTIRREAQRKGIGLYKLLGRRETYLRAADAERLREPVLRIDHWHAQEDAIEAV